MPQESEVATDEMILARALHEIVCDSSDSDAVRSALSALQATEMGRAYLNANPLSI